MHYRIDGARDSPVLMLSNPLATDTSVWDAQIEAFARRFRVVRYDQRGHGKSGITPPPYSMESLGRDVLELMGKLEIHKANWCGLSLGGMIGQWLAANAPSRLNRLILSNTSCFVGDKRFWDARIKAIENEGVEAATEGVVDRWFTPGFGEREAEKVASVRSMILKTSVEGYCGCCAAVRDMDHRSLLSKIDAPTLIIAGRHDPATTVKDAEYLNDGIAGSKLVVLESSHLSSIEQAERFTDEVVGFLTTETGIEK